MKSVSILGTPYTVEFLSDKDDKKLNSGLGGYCDVLVNKGDVLARKVDSETAEAFEVILSDEAVFVVAPVVYDENNKCYVTDYEKMQAYSNEPSINSLQILGFTKD